MNPFTARDLARAMDAKRIGKGWMAWCPVHEVEGRNQKRSLKIDEGHDGKPLIHCYAGCSNDDIIAKLQGAKIWPQSSRKTGNARHAFATMPLPVFAAEVAPNAVRPDVAGERPNDATLAAFAARYGLEYSDFQEHGCSLKSVHFERGPAWSICYPTAKPDGGTGQKMKTVSRFDKATGAAVQWPDGKRDAQHAKGGSGFFPPSQVSGPGLLVVTGGEEKALACLKAGFRAVSWSNGEGSLSEVAVEALLTAGNREFVLALDNDGAGRRGTEKMARALVAAGATVVRVVQWSSTLPSGFDVNDVLRDHGAGALQSLIASAVAWTAPSEPVAPDHNLDHTANGLRFASQHGDNVRYVAEWKKWLVWDGKIWIPDSGDLLVREMAKATARRIHEEAGSPDNARHFDNVTKWARASAMRAGVDATLAMARSVPPLVAKAEDFDSHPYLLTLRNGTLNLKTGQILTHSREHLITRMAPVDFDPAATCPKWAAFLGDVTDGNAELVSFLAKAIGYSLTDSMEHQCIFVLHGNGANGKTTFVEAVRSMLGPYAAQADPASFLTAERNGSAPREDLVALRGVRLVAAAEITAGRKLDEAFVKQLTGGEPLSIRGNYGSQFTMTPRCKIWMSVNHLPTISGQDIGIWRRIKIIPFNVTICTDKRDPQLLDKLKAEAPGILNWALAGWMACERDGLKEPALVQDATSDYREESDVLAGFLGECCTPLPFAQTRSSELFEAYSNWCKRDGQPAASVKAFSLMLCERGFEKVHGRAGNGFRGIALRKEDSSAVAA